MRALEILIVFLLIAAFIATWIPWYYMKHKTVSAKLIGGPLDQKQIRVTRFTQTYTYDYNNKTAIYKNRGSGLFEYQSSLDENNHTIYELEN